MPIIPPQKHSTSSSPELLAPAGSVDCFHAAVSAGANAVYLGLGDFNARLRAKNFTIRDLSTMIPYAHDRGVKVYVTLNTLIKQSEIVPALNVLYQLDQLGVDAVIMADIGLMRLSNDNFPSLRIHGSTQAAVHNSYGADFLRTLGVKRAVLARELSLEEIEETTKRSSIETEVFIHGALCYSMSGMCLASSFIGGASGNRGRCTQVCRRRFKSIATDGYFFSPYDLQALPFINKLAKAGVACFKIEGRMKSAEYVNTVVKAYRHAIDYPDDIDTAEKALRFDFGRAKTAFFMDDRRGEAIDPNRPSGTGIFLGTVVDVDEGAFCINGINDINDTMTIEKGDRLRIHPKDGFEGVAYKVASCQSVYDKIKITPSQPIKCAVGDSVFLIGKVGINTKIAGQARNDGDFDKVVMAGSTRHLQEFREIGFRQAKRIADSLTPQLNPNIPTNKNPSTKTTLWFKADRLQWLDLITATPCQRLIFDADIGEIESLINTPDVLKTWRSRVSIALPPFIEESKLTLWRDIVDRCRSLGLNSFTISNVGHIPLVINQKNRNCDVSNRIIADSLLWCLNRFTRAELLKRGIDNFVFSWEDEYLNIRDNVYPPPTSGAVPTVAPIYGRPPLFISRMKPAVNTGETAVDPHGDSFFVSTRNGLYYTLPTTPVCLFAKRKKLSECGVNDFLIDVSFHEPSYELIGELMSGFKDGVRIGGGSIFNFKAGLK